MKCIACNVRDAKGNTELCDPCRLKKWRKDNPDKIKAYLKRTVDHRQKHRDDNKEKIRIQSDIRRYGIAREIIFNRDNWKCQDCGMGIEYHIKKWGKSFDIHHKDGNGIYSKKPNNNPKNLITLCCSCHCARDNKLKPKIKRGEKLIRDESEYRFPELRKLVNKRAEKLESVKAAKKIIAKEMGVSYWTIESKYFERKKCVLVATGEGVKNGN